MVKKATLEELQKRIRGFGESQKELIFQISKKKVLISLLVILLTNQPLLAGVSLGNQVIPRLGKALKNLVNPLLPPLQRPFLPKRGIGYDESLRELVESTLERKLDEMQIMAINKVASMLMHSQTTISNTRMLMTQMRVLQEANFSREEIQNLGNLLFRPEYYRYRERGHQGSIKERKRFYLSKLHKGSGGNPVGRIGKINHRRIEVDFLDPLHPGKLVKKKFSPVKERISVGREQQLSLISALNLKQNEDLFGESLHLHFNVLFEAIKSPRKKITLEDLALPPPSSEESLFQRQGYEERYIKGIDDVNEWAILRKQLIELRANLYRTHIEYFANQIELFIAHVRKAIKNSTQMANLEILEKQAEKAISKKKVTYLWWLQFNNSLAHLLTYGKLSFPYPNSIFGEFIEADIGFFPLKILMPTLQGDLGIMAFNKAHTENIYPLGIITAPIELEGIERTPFEFFIHDIAHSKYWKARYYSPTRMLFLKKILKIMESLPMQERKKAEMVFFFLTHEGVRGNASISDRNFSIQEELNSIRPILKRDDTLKLEGDLESYFDIFQKVYLQAQGIN